MRYDSHAIAEDSHNSSSTSESIVIDSYRAVVGTQIQLTPCWTKVGNETLSLDESCVVFCPWTRALDVIRWTVETPQFEYNGERPNQQRRVHG
jgi:hypothetical protein